MIWSGFDSSGEFFAKFCGSEPTQGELDDNGIQFLVLGDFLPTDYLNDLQTVPYVPVPRPSFDFSILVASAPATDPVILQTGDVLRIENIPAGTQVDYPEGSLVVDDGYIEWSSLTPGSTSFSFINFPYLELIINATVTGS